MADARRWRSKARGRPDLGEVFRRLGRRVRELRRLRGLTLDQLARAADVTSHHLQAVEVGRVNATLATLHGVALALEVPVSALFDPPGRPPRRG